MKELEETLRAKLAQYKYPMQELHITYNQTKGRIYSEEEDRYLLCRLSHYGLNGDDVYERIKKDVNDFPVFRFDWFLRSRTTVELSRRCTTLLSLISKEQNGYRDEEEEEEVEEVKPKPKGKVRIRQCPPSCDGLTEFYQKRTIDDVAPKASRSSTPANGNRRSHKKKKT